MKYCPYCGEQLMDDAQFCSFCGARVAATNAGPVNSNPNNVRLPSQPQYQPVQYLQAGSPEPNKGGLGKSIASLILFFVPTIFFIVMILAVYGRAMQGIEGIWKAYVTLGFLAILFALIYCSCMVLSFIFGLTGLIQCIKGKNVAGIIMSSIPLGSMAILAILSIIYALQK